MKRSTFVLLAMPLHISVSTLSLSEWQLSRLLSIVGRHHSLADRPGWERLVVLVWTGGWCEFGGLVTNCLPCVSHRGR